MTTCPRCGTALKDEYGMSQCPGCGAFSFIDMDGHAVIQDATPPEDSPVDPNHGASSIEPGGAASASEFSDPIESMLGLSSGADSETTPSSEFESQPAAPSDFAAIEPFGGEDFSPIEMSVPEVAPEQSETEPSTSQPEPAFGPADDPLNLNHFANSEVSSAKDGPLLVRVLISGIDTREIRESIREVLEDSRFAWDSGEIFSKISKGHLAVDGLSPVKASILITRIKRLPVQIRWEQYAITQAQN